MAPDDPHDVQESRPVTAPTTTSTRRTPGGPRTGAVHEVSWEHVGDGRVAGRITCRAEVGAPCRSACAADEDRDCDDRDHAHALVDTGRCALVAAAAREGVEALHDDPAGTPVRSGPVTVHRDGYGWGWRYAG
jgi:hypothetical protein